MLRLSLKHGLLLGVWRHVSIAVTACAALAGALQAQAAGVPPPMRADIALIGNLAASDNRLNLLECQRFCQRTPNCSGFTSYSARAETVAQCRAFRGALTEAPQAGVVSCRMPCTAPPASSPPPSRASVLPAKEIDTSRLNTGAPTLSVPSRLMPPPPASAPPSDPKK
jgi:hypothetical protein